MKESWISMITQHYDYFLMVASSLASVLLKDIARDTIKRITGSADSNKKRGNKEKSSNNKVISYAVGFILYVLFYFVLCVSTVYVYANIRAKDMHDSVNVIYDNMLDRYFWSNVPSFITVPVIVGIIEWVMDNKKMGFTYFIKIIFTLAAGLLLIFSPYIVNPGKVTDLPMESEILTELRSMDFPYEDRIFNPIHLQALFSNGYWTTDNLEPSINGNNNDGEEQEEKQEPIKDISHMSFVELLEAVEYYSSKHDADNIAFYLNVAYIRYLAEGANRINNWNAIGRMFYYMGENFDSAYYKDGVKAFLHDNEYVNALYCYRNLFDILYDEYGPNNYDVIDVTEEMMSLLGKIIAEGQSNDNVVSLIENAYVKTFVDGHNSLQENLDVLCRSQIDSPLLQTLNIVNHMTDGKYEDGETLKVLLQKNKYKNCPKLLILYDIYKFHLGQEYTVEPLYQLYKEYPDYFEHEDRINLVWLLYESGEYIRTYEVSRELTEVINDEENKYSDGKDDTGEEIDEAANEKSLKYQMLLIRAESYLQDSQSLSEVDENKLYMDVTDALKELGVVSIDSLAGSDEMDNLRDKVNDENKKDESDTENNLEVEPIKNPITARLRLVKCILAGRIGLDTSYKGLSEICEELFHTDSKTGLYIIASLSHQDGDETRTIALCNQIIEMADTKDNFQSRVLMLKADALIALAVKDDVSQEQKNSFYDEAEDILISVRNMAQNDYIASSWRLVEVYEATKRYDEAYAIREELMEFKQEDR